MHVAGVACDQVYLRLGHLPVQPPDSQQPSQVRWKKDSHWRSIGTDGSRSFHNRAQSRYGTALRYIDSSPEMQAPYERRLHTLSLCSKQVQSPLSHGFRGLYGGHIGFVGSCCCHHVNHLCDDIHVGISHIALFVSLGMTR